MICLKFRLRASKDDCSASCFCGCSSLLSDIDHRNLNVCNPLTQSFKELPTRSVKVWSRIAVGMTDSEWKSNQWRLQDSVSIWELQKMTLLWKEVDRMPNIWCLEYYGNHVRMTCLGDKGLLMVSLRSRQMNRLVTYNVMSREWLKVPGCIVPPGRKRQIQFDQLVTFQEH